MAPVGSTVAERPLSRDAIKYIAMFTMFLNHAAVFLPYNSIWHDVFVDIGYFTAVTMCYFLVEGYAYTRSKTRYGLRLLLFAALAQIPYTLATGAPGSLRFHGFNMLFTLFCCFLLLFVGEKVRNPVLRNALRVLLVLCTVNSDWPLLAALYTWLFDWAGKSRGRLKIAYLSAALLFGLLTIPNGLYLYPPVKAALRAVCESAGIFASGFCILYLYNGKRAERGRSFSKWFFYAFYSAHLLILGLLRTAAPGSGFGG